MRNFFAIFKKGVGIVLGTILLMIGGGIGLEDWLAPRTINIPIMIFSLAAIIVGTIILWLTFKKNENRHTEF